MRYVLFALAELAILLHLGSRPRHGYRAPGAPFAHVPMGMSLAVNA